MKVFASIYQTPPAPALRPGRRGFSMVEVILAVGILAVAIVSLIGLIGPTLSAVRTVAETNAATASIGKLNAVMESTAFYPVNRNSPTYSADQFNCVYTWILNSTESSPTVFLFYDEIPAVTENPVPQLKIIRFNKNEPKINSRYTETGTDSDLSALLKAFEEGRVSGLVMGMSISLSPLARNFNRPTSITELGKAPTSATLWTNVYREPSGANIFSDNNLRNEGISNPNESPQGDVTGGSSTVVTLRYPEAYLPIFVQVFSVSMDHLSRDGEAGFDPVKDFTVGNRLFTYTIAKMR